MEEQNTPQMTALQITVPVVMPVLVPVMVPSIVPMSIPIVMPIVVPVSMSMGGFSATMQNSTEERATPVPIEAVAEEAAPAPQTLPEEPVNDTTAAEPETPLSPDVPVDLPHFPLKIVSIKKIDEIVVLQNVSQESVDLTGWRMVSVLGSQQHPLDGSIAPGETRYFPNYGKKIWNDSRRDDGALYNPDGQAISYWTDQA